MLFHLVPEDMFQTPAMSRRPCYFLRGPDSQSQHFRGHGTLPDAFLPMLMATRCCNAGESRSACCRRQTADCEQKQSTTKKDCGGKMEESTKANEKKIATFDFRGFAPEQIKVKVTDKAVIIRGERKDSYSSVQITKSLPLPKGADKTGVVCRYVDGHVVIRLPSSDTSCLKERAERKEGTVEAITKEGDTTGSAENSEQCAECPKKMEDSSDTDRKMQEEFEKSMKTLTGLFSNIFGLQLDGEEDEEVEKKTDKEDSGKGENSAAEKTNGTAPHADDDVGNGDSKENSQYHCRDTEETCPMLKYEEKLSLKDNDNDFVHVEKHEAAADDSLRSEQTTDTELEGDEGDEPVTVQADDTETPLPEVDVLASSSTKDTASIQNEAEEFKIQLDLTNYKPENIQVVLRDGDIIVEAEREIEGENHFEVEKLSRRIRLPEKVDESKLQSVLDARGVMSIRAPFSSDEDQKWKIFDIKMD